MKVKCEEMKQKAMWVRREVLEMCVRTRSGHIVSSFSCTDILVALYYGGILRFDPDNPDWDGRDRFIISKGHGAIALYPILADLGFCPVNELSKYCEGGGIFGAHPDHHIPGVEVSTGSLGHGLGIAAGMALSAKMDGKDHLTIALLGDGECYEGSVWESAMFTAHHRLERLIGIIDRNRLSVTDFTEKNLRLEPFEEKWKSFGWETISIDGHSFDELLHAFSALRDRDSGVPLMVIANTVKGKGVSFMENRPLAHTMVPNSDQLLLARKELEDR